MVRIDSTVTAGADARADRQLSAVGRGARDGAPADASRAPLPGRRAIVWRNHRRLAKKRALAIQYSRGKDRKAKLYRDLIAATRATLAALQHAAQRLSSCASLEAEPGAARSSHYLPLIERVISQTERRVLAGEAVPAGEKLVSLFEPHADIIVKGGRDVHYGHKLNLATGRSGLILDVVIEAGNPADAERFLPMLERHIALYGTPAAPDGRRRRLCQPRQSRTRPKPWACAMSPSTKSAAWRSRHGQEPLGLPQAAQLPRRHRGRHLLPEARLRPGALHLARARSLQGLRLVVGRRLQSDAYGATEADVACTIDQHKFARPGIRRCEPAFGERERAMNS